MDLGIEGLRVLVTAGASGIGLEIARAFVREGARVHVTDIDPAALDGLAASDPDLTHSTGDVSDRADAARFFDEALQALGGLDVLVNNAGIAGPTGRVEEINPEDWDRCLEVCLTGQFNCARLAVPHLKQEPKCLHHQSVLGGGPLRLRAALALCGGKVGRDRLHKSLSMELGDVRYPGERDPAGACGRRPDPAGVGGQSPAARDLLRGDGV